MDGMFYGPHMTRYFMYERLRKIGELLPSRKGDVLSLNHSEKLCEVAGIQAKQIQEGNILNQNPLPFADESFDFVVSDHVLEHVRGDPQTVFNESWRVLRKNGVAIHTTCFLNPLHNEPEDYWRFSSNALRLLSGRFSKVLDCDGWGNFEALMMIRNGAQAGELIREQHPFYHVVMKNDPVWPIVTWIVVQK